MNVDDKIIEVQTEAKNFVFALTLSTHFSCLNIYDKNSSIDLK